MSNYQRPRGLGLDFGSGWGQGLTFGSGSGPFNPFGDGSEFEQQGTPAAGPVHVVQRGETLATIAARYRSTVAAIAAANGIRNVNLIHVGQRLTIPGGTAPAPSPQANTQPPQGNDAAARAASEEEARKKQAEQTQLLLLGGAALVVVVLLTSR